MALGSDLLGFFASPPAWAIESKPIKLTNKIPLAEINCCQLNLPFILFVLSNNPK